MSSSDNSGNKSNRRNLVGLWLVGILGAIGSVMGIRYASSEGWWSNMMNREKLVAYQTINTGASVQILALDAAQESLLGGASNPISGGTEQPSSVQGAAGAGQSMGQGGTQNSARRSLW